MNAPFPHRQAYTRSLSPGRQHSEFRFCPAEAQLHMEAEQFGTVYVPPERIIRAVEGEPRPIFSTKPMTGWQCAMFTLLMVVIFGLAVVA